MAPRQRVLQNLFLILTVLPCCSSVVVSIPKKEYEIARGEDVSLTCSFVPANPNPPTYVITWEAFPNNDHDTMQTVATIFKGLSADIAPAYEGRASLNIDEEERMTTLTLTKVTLQDNRRYQCSVTIPQDDEGTPAVSTSLLVLVPPSPPICGIQGTAEYFHNITLTCESEEGSPAPTYGWKSFSMENAPRAFPPKTVQKDGALSLFNITIETTGVFKCTSTNRISSATCDFTLTVMPPSSNIGTIIGVMVGVIAGVIILGILIYCLYRKKSKKKAQRERPPGDVEFHDTDIPEVGEKFRDDQSASDKKQGKKYKDKDDPPQNKRTMLEKLDDDDSDSSERRDGKGSETNSHAYKDQRDQYRGSRDRLDDQRDQYRGSRDRLDDRRDQYRGSRDRLDDHRDQFRGSRDRLDDGRDRYDRGRTDHYHSSRDDYSDRGGHHTSSHGQSDDD